MLDFPNELPVGFERLPASCQVVQWKAGLTRQLVERQAKFLSELDPDVAKEFREELAELDEELGADIGRDFLDVMGSSVLGAEVDLPQIAAHFAGPVDAPERFQKCAAALAGLNETPLGKTEEGGRTLHVLPLALPVFYAFEDGWLAGSTRKGAIADLLAPGLDRPSIANSPAFDRLRGRLPSESLLLWAMDVRWAAQLVSSFGPRLPDLAEVVSAEQLAGLLMPLLEVEPGLTFGFTLHNEPDAFVLSLESVAVDPWQLVPGVIRGVVELSTVSPR
jgi:hypothetical protein